ncbi:molybdopterin oxidoreductase [Thermococci archaeon]|nr:MAG: molybdopterin oxidoreductase [Thermococci archaeon]
MGKVYRFTCIVCPLSCAIEVEVENGEVRDVKGYTCPRGKEWAIEEVTNPKRVVMSVIPVEGGKLPTVSVKTEKPVPKDEIPELMKFLAGIKVKPPIRVGDVIAEFEGVRIVATRDA